MRGSARQGVARHGTARLGKPRQGSAGHSRCVVRIELSLPFPPSSNKIWRYHAKHVAISPEYLKWKKTAWAMFLQQFGHVRPEALDHFQIKVTLDERQRGRSDGDNRLKAVLDFVQAVKLVKNDCDCDLIICKWGVAPMGCEVVLVPTPDAQDASTAPAAGTRASAPPEPATRRFSAFWETAKSQGATRSRAAG